MTGTQITSAPPLDLVDLAQRVLTIGAVGKGSGGKSTLLTCLAAAAVNDKHHALLIDADAQKRSLMDWLQLRAATQDQMYSTFGRPGMLSRIDVAMLAPGDAE